MTEREQFEAHLRALPHFPESPNAWTYERDTLGNYRNNRVDDMWHGWQASRPHRFVNWADAVRLIEAAHQASKARLLSGSSNWAAFVCKAMESGSPQIPPAIMEMAKRIAADKFHHCTKDPIFTVQKRRIISGIDTDYADNIGWFSDDGGHQITGDKAAALEAEYQKTWKMPADYTRTGYAEEWQHHATYITQEAAKALVAAKGKDYRVYVDSGYANREWQALREFLLSLAPKEAA